MGSCSCQCKVKEHHCNSLQDYKEDECRCACRNLAARRNCWGSNKLWDETRSRRPLMKNLFLPLLIQFCNSDVSSHPIIHLSCVCRCRNSGVSCSTGTLFNPE